MTSLQRRRAALLLTVLTGTTGLVYEVTWQKLLAVLLGSDSEATAAVLALFLGGLALGYHAFGRVTRRLAERAARGPEPILLLQVYGAVEIGIGLHALSFPFQFQLARALSLRVPVSPEGLAFACDVGLSALLIVPPTVLMGATIPMLSEALAARHEDASTIEEDASTIEADVSRVHARIYAMNTLGAFAGALLAGFALISLLGLEGTLYAMAVVNLAAGALFIGLGRPTASPAPPAAPPRSSRAGSLAAVAALLGFGMMTIQTVANRIGALAFGASHHTFALIVAVFVLCIALGSLAASALPRLRPRSLAASQWALVLCLGALYFALPASIPWAYRLRTLFGSSEAARLAFHAGSLAGVMALLAVPVALSGATLPLLFDRVRSTGGDPGAVAGRLYAWNTLGSLVGALGGGYVLLFWLDLHHVYRLAVAAIAIGAALVTWRAAARPGLAAAALALCLAGIAVLPGWNQARLSMGLFRKHAVEPTPEMRNREFGEAPELRQLPGRSEIVFYDDDPVQTVVVRTERRRGRVVRQSIFNNGKSDGAVPDDDPTTTLLALVPALLAERAERAFVIGYGAGVSVGELAALESMQQVVVAEISPGVLAAAPLFHELDRGASRSPRVRTLRTDAYRALLRDPTRYDVIVSEPSNPWVSGVEMLFSREFLQAVQSRLTPGGVYAHWMHLYECDDATVELVLRTFHSVFGRTAVWYGLGEDLILLGLTERARPADVVRLEARSRRPDFRAGLQRAGVSGFGELLAHELLPVGVAQAAQRPGRLHTLLDPLLSHQAASAFFRGATARLPATGGDAARRMAAQNGLIQRYQELAGGRLPDQTWQEILRETCGLRPRECATLLASRLAQGEPEPGSSWLDDWPFESPVPRRSLVESLARLYRGGRDADLARRYHYHAVPFPAAASASSADGAAESGGP